VPILTILFTQYGTLGFDVKAYEPGDKYCAISHVWGDYFTSMQDNAIPQCRLARVLLLLKSRVQASVQEILGEGVLENFRKFNIESRIFGWTFFAFHVARSTKVLGIKRCRE
jgi:hypothetical protein